MKWVNHALMWTCKILPILSELVIWDNSEVTGVSFDAKACLIVFNESVSDRDYSSDLWERYEVPSEDKQYSILSLQ